MSCTIYCIYYVCIMFFLFVCVFIKILIACYVDIVVCCLLFVVCCLLFVFCFFFMCILCYHNHETSDHAKMKYRLSNIRDVKFWLKYLLINQLLDHHDGTNVKIPV